ncbi:MAG: DUF1957 domain-containing protein [Myxococcales bacterium]|nr:DUF1957 domain-containing protein [Myxococcales bacterium]
MNSSSNPKPAGCLLLVLHAHLPFVRHVEHSQFYEEDWLFEAIEGCYLPLLDVFTGWVKDGVPARILFSISPPLIAMWQDPALQGRFRAYLDRRSAIWAEELIHHYKHPSRRAIAGEEVERLGRIRRLYEMFGGDLVDAFGQLEAAGVLELMTTAGTHPLLPLFAHQPEFIRSQVRAGVVAHTQAFGHPPAGFWLPECGWFADAGSVLSEAGIRYTFVESTGLLNGAPSPHCGLRRPVVTSEGLLVFGRDPLAARQVWSRDVGYPGEPWYLDFHSDRSFQLSEDMARPYRLATGVRVPLRLRYHRVTDRRVPPEEKLDYDSALAMAETRSHAEHFLRTQERELRSASEGIGWSAYTVALFDAELFGHWWREGPTFIDQVVRKAQGRVRLVAGADALSDAEPIQVSQPALSTWGEGGDASVWLGPRTSWIWPRLLDAITSLTEVSTRLSSPTPLTQRALSQAAREIFLASASDWPFLIRLDTAPEYATQRIQTHLEHANRLLKMLQSNEIIESELRQIEVSTPLFPWMNYPHLSGVIDGLN